MKKSVWMAQLDHALSREGLSGSEKRTVLNYYEEMFLDKRDDGMSEDEILKEFGFPDDVAQSVRENENRERGSSRRGERKFSDGYDDRGYSRYGDANREQPYRNAYDGYGDNGYNPNAGGYAQTPPPPPPQQPPYNNYQNQQKPQKNSAFSSITEIILTLIRVALVIALVVAGAGIIIGGGATAVASFFTFSEGFAVWLIVFGVGIVLIACGCLIFAAGIKIAKGFSAKEGAK